MLIVLNDQGGDRMDVTDDVTATLRAEAHHPPIVLSLGDCSVPMDSNRSKGQRQEVWDGRKSYPLPCLSEQTTVYV